MPLSRAAGNVTEEYSKLNRKAPGRIAVPARLFTRSAACLRQAGITIDRHDIKDCRDIPVVIPAQVGIRGGDAGPVNGWRVLSDAHVLSFPLAGTDCPNRWIPACAGITEGRLPAFIHPRGRRRCQSLV